MCSFVPSSRQVNRGLTQSSLSNCNPAWSYLPPQHLVFFFASCNFWRSCTLISSSSISLGGPRTSILNSMLSPFNVNVICDSLRFQLSISILPFATLVLFITYRLITVTSLYLPTSFHCLSLFTTCSSDGRNQDTYTNSSHHCNFVWFALSSRATNSTSVAMHLGLSRCLPEVEGPTHFPYNKQLEPTVIDLLFIPTELSLWI